MSQTDPSEDNDVVSDLRHKMQELQTGGHTGEMVTNVIREALPLTHGVPTIDDGVAVSPPPPSPPPPPASDSDSGSSSGGGRPPKEQ